MVKLYLIDKSGKKNKNGFIEVSFWSFFKCSFLSWLVIYGIAIVVYLALGIFLIFKTFGS
jgi:hypothetical protein